MRIPQDLIETIKALYLQYGNTWFAIVFCRCNRSTENRSVQLEFILLKNNKKLDELKRKHFLFFVLFHFLHLVNSNKYINV